MIRKRRCQSPPSPEPQCWTPCLPSTPQSEVSRYLFYLRKREFLVYYREDDDTEMDWINCNSCCRQPGDEKDRTFVLTSCGHIFCDLCLSQVESQDKCGVCASQCQLIHLSSKMKPDAEMFFQEPAALLKRHYAQINRLLDFQKDHRVRLVSFHRKILQKYKSLEKQHSSASNQMQEMERRYTSATNRIQELEQENQRLRSMVTQDRGGGGGNMSLASLDGQSRAAITPKNPSPKQSPGSTRISPGRLTLVKAGPGQRGGPGLAQPSLPAPPPVPYGVAGVTSGGHYHQPAAPPQSYHYLPHQAPHHHTLHDDHHSQPGVGYYRNYSPAQPHNPSPTRGSTGSLNQMPLLPPQHHISPAHRSSYQTQRAPYPHHPPPSSHTQAHSLPPARPFAPGTISSILTSPDPFVKPHPNQMAYKKFGM